MFLQKYKKRQLILQFMFRKKYKTIFYLYLLLKFLIKNNILEKQIKILSIFYIIQINKYNVKSLHKNICLLSGHKRSINRYFKLNRMSVLDNLNSLVFPGIKRAVW